MQCGSDDPQPISTGPNGKRATLTRNHENSIFHHRQLPPTVADPSQSVSFTTPNLQHPLTPCRDVRSQDPAEALGHRRCRDPRVHHPLAQAGMLKKIKILTPGALSPATISSLETVEAMDREHTTPEIRRLSSSLRGVNCVCAHEGAIQKRILIAKIIIFPPPRPHYRPRKINPVWQTERKRCLDNGRRGTGDL